MVTMQSMPFAYVGLPQPLLCPDMGFVLRASLELGLEQLGWSTRA